VITAYDAYQIRLSSGRAGRPTAARSGCRSTRRLRACKTCDIEDPTQHIVWVTPEGGGRTTPACERGRPLPNAGL